jgi:hypothetical protein
MNTHLHETESVELYLDPSSSPKGSTRDYVCILKGGHGPESRFEFSTKIIMANLLIGLLIRAEGRGDDLNQTVREFLELDIERLHEVF